MSEAPLNYLVFVVSPSNAFPAQSLAEFSSHSRSEAENSVPRDFTNEFFKSLEFAGE